MAFDHVLTLASKLKANFDKPIGAASRIGLGKRFTIVGASAAIIGQYTQTLLFKNFAQVLCCDGHTNSDSMSFEPSHNLVNHSKAPLTILQLFISSHLGVPVLGPQHLTTTHPCSCQ